VVLDGRGGEVDVGPHVAVVGVPEERGHVDVHRKILERRDTAIGHARVVQVLVAERELRAVAGREGEGRVDA
jgi:hypothetical protein